MRPLGRWVTRGSVAAISTAALAAAGLAGVASAQASAIPHHSLLNPYAPAYHHAYRHGAVPTIPAQHKMNVWNASHPAAGKAQLLAYGGGPIGTTSGGKEKVYVVIYGSQWGTAGTDSNGNTTMSHDPSGEAPLLQQLFKGLGTNNEKWSGVMTQYCDGVAKGATSCPAGNSQHVVYPTGGALAGVWVDTASASPGQATGKQLAMQAIAAAAHFGNTTAAANRDSQYDILSPTGTHPDGFNTPSGQFCAWHDYNADPGLPGGPASSPYGNISFTNMPYVTDAGTSCGQDFVNANGTDDGVSIVNGHEYAETITDQDPAEGWTTPTAEDGDLCAWKTPGTAGGSFNLSLSTGSFAMQTTYSNNPRGCKKSHAIVTK